MKISQYWFDSTVFSLFLCITRRKDDLMANLETGKTVISDSLCSSVVSKFKRKISVAELDLTISS